MSTSIEDYVKFLAKPMKDKDMSEARNVAAADLKVSNPGIYDMVVEKIAEYKKEFPESEYFYLKV